MKALFGLALVLFAIILGCAPFLESPFSDKLLSNETDMNIRAQNHLGDIESDSIVRIALIADVHQNYSALNKVTAAINRAEGIDFVVNLGDFTNSSYNLEYDQYIDSVSAMNRPTFTVIGNHDALGSGPRLYRRAFSQPNFLFESNSYRFIFYNTANLENPEEFSVSWLKQAVTDSTKPIVIFTHCSLLDHERFMNSDGTWVFDDILKDTKVKVVFNGHNHVYSATSYQGTQLLQVERIENNAWATVEIHPDKIKARNMATGENGEFPLKN